MTEDFLKNYRILGVQQGVSWKQLRLAYKKLVNTWHPDRFQDAHQKKRAEEKTKEITQSYKRLAEYHREFGVLPFADGAPEAPVNENAAPPEAPSSPPAGEIRQPRRAAAGRTSPVEKPRQPSFRGRIIAATAFAGIAYILWIMEESKDPGNLPAATAVTNQAAEVTNGAGQRPVTGDSGAMFTIGSSLGEVYTAQGVPTRTEDDIWHYGKSKVYFSKGKVTRWDENSEFPLKVGIAAESEKTTATYFGKGSSKEEVLAIQGPPDRDAGSVWDYGVSRIYFSNNRVSGWHDTPLNPLKVRR